MPKSSPKTDPRWGGEIVTPFAAESVVCTAGAPKPLKSGPDIKKHHKSCLEGVEKKPSVEHGRAMAGSPKTQNRFPKNAREETTNDDQS